MSALDLEEQERIDALKDWWARRGTLIYIVVAVALAAFAGMQGWQYFQRGQAEKAEEMLKNLQKIVTEAKANPQDAKGAKKVSEAASVLASKFSATFAATEAQMVASRVAFDAADYAAAQTHLQWVVEHGTDVLRDLARLRLASILLDQKKYDEALKQLDAIKEPAYIAISADLKGDIFAAQGKNDEARAAYQLATEKYDNKRSPMLSSAQAKLDAFGGTTAVVAEVGKNAQDIKDTNKGDKGAAK